MTKRIISLLLATVMLLSFPVFAEDAEAPKPDSGNMLFAKALGIVDAGAAGADPVTRIELARMFCAVMRVDIGMATQQPSKFTDVDQADMAVVENISYTGIMNGIGGGLFAPEAPVTYVQAIKAMVTFLGYAQVAEAKSGYPYGYMSQAEALDLTEGAPKDMNTPLTVEKAVELFKLAVNVDYREPVSFDPDVEYKVTKGLTYLEYHRNIVRVRGIVKSTSVSDISGAGVVAYNKVRIDGNVLKFNPSNVNANEFFGHKVDAYAQADDEEVLFIEDAGTNVTEVSSYELIGLAGNNIEYYSENGKKQKIEINASTRIVYNGKNLSSYSDSDLNPFIADAYLDGGITAIYNDGDNISDIVCVEAYKTYTVENIVGNKIYAKSYGGDYAGGENSSILDLDNNADYLEGKDFLLYNVIGEPIKLSDIKAGDTLSVSREKHITPSLGKIKRIVVTIDKLTGVISAISHRNGGLFITVNGQEFECSHAVAKSAAQADTILGIKAEISFNKDGRISNINQEAFDEWKAGYVTSHGTKQGIDPEYQIKLYGDDAQWHVISIADKIYINEATAPSSCADFLTTAGTEASGAIKRKVILYKLNAQGKLSDVIFPTENSTDYDTIKNTSPLYVMKAPSAADRSVEVMANGTNMLYYSNEDAGFEGKAFFTKSTLTFDVPPESDRDEDTRYTIVNALALYDDWSGSEANVYAELYSRSETPVVDIAVNVNNAGSSSPNAKTYGFVVSKVETYLDKDSGAEISKVTGYTNGKMVSYTDPERLLNGHYGVPTGVTVAPGDVLRIVSNNYGEIQNVHFCYDADTTKLYELKNTGTTSSPVWSLLEVPGNGGATDDTYRNMRFVKGEVKYVDGDIMIVKSRNRGDTADTEEYTTTAKHTYTKITKTPRGIVKVEPAALNDIVGFDEYGAGSGSRVVVHLQNARSWGVYIYEGF